MPHAHSAGGPVDVSPAQAQQLALAQTGHGGGEVDRALGRPAGVIRDACDERVELCVIEEAHVLGRSRALWLVDLLARVGRRVAAAPGEVENRVQQAQVVEDALRRETVAALGGDELPADLASQVITDEALCAYIAPSHPLAGRPAIGLHDLGDEPMIVLPRGTGARTALDEGCTAAGVSLRIAFEAGDPLVLAALAARGLGVAILPRSSFEGVGAVALTGPPMRSRMELVWQADGPAAPAARVLLDHLREAVTG